MINYDTDSLKYLHSFKRQRTHKHARTDRRTNHPKTSYVRHVGLSVAHKHKNRHVHIRFSSFMCQRQMNERLRSPKHHTAAVLTNSAFSSLRYPGRSGLPHANGLMPRKRLVRKNSPRSRRCVLFFLQQDDVQAKSAVL